MKLQQLYSHVRKALDDYQMITDGDRIAIGISGGKDSLTLLYALAGLQKFYPKHFDLIAVTVDLGYKSFDLTPIHKLCHDLQIEYHVISTEISSIVSTEKIPKSKCALCARLRKGALYQAVQDLCCTKIAYAHHSDDFIETMLLSLIYEGRFYSFPPVTHFEDTNLTVIRPMMYVSEAEVKGFQNKYTLPVVSNPCPFDGHTKREYAKSILKQLNHETPGVKKQLFHAITTGNICDWPEKSKKSDK